MRDGPNSVTLTVFTPLIGVEQGGEGWSIFGGGFRFLRESNYKFYFMTLI